MLKGLVVGATVFLIVGLIGILIKFLTKAKQSAEQFLEQPDPQYYALAEQEINDGTFDKGLWAKALVNANGKEEQRKIEYMKMRVKQLLKDKVILLEESNRIR